MSTVRSRRWTVEVGELKHQFWQEQPVECVWIDYWQRAGSDTIEVESVSLWAKPWGEEVAQLNALDVRDRVSGWLRALIAKHRPDARPVDTAPEAVLPLHEIADMQAAMRALWPDRPKVYFVPGQGDDAPVLTEEEQGQLRRVALAIADARKPVDTTPEGEVLEADDTVPVERLAHWLHGEFKVSQRPWATVSDPVQSAFRRSARKLMSELPELFR